MSFYTFLSIIFIPRCCPGVDCNSGDTSSLKEFVLLHPDTACRFSCITQMSGQVYLRPYFSNGIILSRHVGPGIIRFVLCTKVSRLNSSDVCDPSKMMCLLRGMGMRRESRDHTREILQRLMRSESESVGLILS